jgi:hypothetical protein
MRRLLLTLLGALPLAAPCAAAELILPQNRNAFYSAEPIEFAVAGLKKDEKAKLELTPATKGLKALSFEIVGDGGTVLAILPGGALAPSVYDLKLDGKAAGKLTVSSGVNVSPLYLSATVSKPKTAGANFFLGNAFGFGLLDQNGQPSRDLRRRSMGMNAFENAVRDDAPTIVYMYWTGYVTHKPFGSEKSWAAKDMMEATRLLSFHTAQRLRRYDKNLLLVGTLDEPGLSWGKTPAGGMASGFPNWDEEDWYAKREWKYTQDPASRDDKDWMKYLTVRCGIMKKMNAQAKKDLKSILPNLTFSTDLYAPQAIMDGTDPLNQQINDVPSSHVFLDWGCSKLGALSGLYLEKSDEPRRKIAHAMNGQLFGKAVPQPNQRNAYRLMLNSMIAAGLYSNWWLNPTGMTNEDLAWVNEPALRLGGMFAAFHPMDHDVAVLWSFTEAGMRQKDVSAREAKKKTGDQIKLKIASLPDLPWNKDKEMEINAYNVGGNYKEQVLNAHQALARAGYPAHILHERVLKEKLKRYKTLVIVGQTFELPGDVRKIIEDWVKGGGVVVVDGTTKVKFEKAVVTKADFRDPAFRWGAYFGKAEMKDHPFANDREASYYHTNYFMDDMARKATPAMKEAMKKTKSQPAIETDSVHLAAERHTGTSSLQGDASLYLVINANDELPKIGAKERYSLYNYAPLETTFTLKGIAPKSVVYCFEGQDWKKVREVTDYDKPQKAKFEPGEMKLYLVLPKKPGKLQIQERTRATDKGLTSVVTYDSGWSGYLPCVVTVTDPKDNVLYRVHRCLPEQKAPAGAKYPPTEYPLGSNAPAGDYVVTAECPATGDKATKTVTWKGAAITPGVHAEAVAMLDGSPTRALLAGGPLLIAYGKDHKAVAEKLAGDLKAKGVDVTVKPESEVLRKVHYPRVWNPFADVWSAAGDEKKHGEVKVEVSLGTAKDGKLTAVTKDKKDVSQDWKQPFSLVTITGEGFVDFSGDREQCYEPGVKLYFDKDRHLTVVKGTKAEEKTTAEFRKKWSKPWDRLTSHQGAYQLPAQLPEAYTTDSHLILLGDSTTSDAVAVLQASEILPRMVDAKYPGPGKALIQYAYSPFAVEKDVIFVGASDKDGLEEGVKELLKLAPKK